MEIRHVAEMIQVIPRELSRERTPMELITGNTPDISPLMNFRIYSWIKYWEHSGFSTEGG
jgi:hypothetical protein